MSRGNAKQWVKIPMGKDQEKWAEGDNHKWVGDEKNELSRENDE